MRGLTFDLSGLPKAGPLEGMVRALVGLKPIGSHHAELVLFVFFEFGPVFQVGLARTKTDSALSGRPAFEKRCFFALGHVHRLGTKARWLPKGEGLAPLQPKDARTLNGAAGERLRPCTCRKEADDLLEPF